MYFEYYLMGIILLPGIILAIIAQTNVSSTYNTYSQVFAKSGIQASELIKRLLTTCDLSNINVKKINGHLTDYYDPKQGEICLSQSVYDSSSISALGVACHEFGHALQKKESYFPYQIRRFLIPVTNFASRLLWPLIIIGLIFNFGAESQTVVGNVFLYSGVIFFGLAVLLNLATLPVEFNASSRAIKILSSTNTLNEEELEGAKKVLNAAALTYVAALVVSMLNLLRFLLVVINRRR